jgi:hypothetical protein
MPDVPEGKIVKNRRRRALTGDDLIIAGTYRPAGHAPLPVREVSKVWVGGDAPPALHQVWLS